MQSRNKKKTRNHKLIGTENRLVVARGRNWGQNG